jgi:hypothetical protein
MVALDRVHAVLSGGTAPDTNVGMVGAGTAASPFVIDTLPFVDSDDATAITYSLNVTAPTRVRAIAFGAGTTVAIANLASPAHIVQQQLAAGDYTLTVSGGTYDLVIVACDAGDAVCD